MRVYDVALRVARRQQLSDADAEEVADKVQGATIGLDRSVIQHLEAYVSRAALQAAQSSRSRRRRRRTDNASVTEVEGGIVEPKEELDRKRTERLGLDLARVLDSMPEKLDYLPEGLGDTIGIVAERWREERNMSEAVEQNIVWILFALARGDNGSAAIARMAATARRSFPRDRFREMREHEKPPFARSPEELARLLLAEHQRTKTTALKLAARMTSLAITLWLPPPLKGRSRTELEALAQNAVALATADRRVRETERAEREGVTAVRTMMKSWGFRGTDNLLKRL